MQRSSVLERTSRFVLEVMPYLLTALIAVLVVPSLLFSQAQGAKLKMVPVPYVHAIDLDRMPSDGVTAAQDWVRVR
jgi:hypothetical protein